MASTVEICNRALQKLGAKRIVSLSDDSVNARACNAAFESIKLAELRNNTWNFSISRAQLAADVIAPSFGPAYSYTLPSDFLRLLPPDPESNSERLDWSIEGKKIFTNDSAPLEIRYVANVTDPNQMDAAFREALSCKLAYELCEELTQSNTKKADLREDYKKAIQDAGLTSAIEKPSVLPPEDVWITVRR